MFHAVFVLFSQLYTFLELEVDCVASALGFEIFESLSLSHSVNSAPHRQSDIDELFLNVPHLCATHCRVYPSHGLQRWMCETQILPKKLQPKPPVAAPFTISVSFLLMIHHNISNSIAEKRQCTEQAKESRLDLTTNTRPYERRDAMRCAAV